MATLGLMLSVLGLFLGYGQALYQCGGDVTRCAAMLSIYQSGVTPELYPATIESYDATSGSSVAANLSLKPSLWRTVIEAIQVTSVYLLLLSVVILILLELKELKYLRQLVHHH